MVLKSGVAPPGDPVVGGQFTGALSLVEQDGLLQDFRIVVLRVRSALTDANGTARTQLKW